jgi:hypothetical protein
MSGHRIPILVAALLLVLQLAGCADNREPAPPPPPSGPYLGQPGPGSKPVLFGPDLVSTGMYERDVAMTPDGNEIYFGLVAAGRTTIAYLRQVDGAWSGPEIAPFSQDPSVFDFEPFITADGSKMYFLSTRAPQGQEPKPGWGHQNIWVMDREGEGWSEPREVGPPVNSDAGEYYPSLTLDGILYFTRGLPDGRSLVFRSRMLDGAFQEPEQLPAEVNSVDMQFNAFIAPDESYLIFCAAGREDTVGRADYYISFRDQEDNWAGPIPMGERFNSENGAARSMSLSPDGRYLFFSSNRKIEDDGAEAADSSYPAMKAGLTTPGNGAMDIYWVDATVIEELRP